MNWHHVLLIARHYFKRKFTTKSTILLLLVFIFIQGYVALDRWQSFETQSHLKVLHQAEDRQSWESNPDKHPHRMAHFGAYAFRHPHPLSIFDTGLENYMGNAIFLEAHKQNTANFSEANFSTGAVRFGDINVAFMLYFILPLILFFIGYDAISKEREDESLKLMIMQGTKLQSIFWGKSLGLFFGSTLFFLPAIMLLWSILFLHHSDASVELLTRATFTTLAYISYFLMICFFIVYVSGKSMSSNQSLLTLLSFWFVFFILLPKTAQVAGGYFYPNPTKTQFKKNIEEDIIKIGDSHNPHDPYFKSIKDSLLNQYNVASVEELPFNYSGYISGIGEELTSTIFKKHESRLRNNYQSQNQFNNVLSILNPYLSIKHISMGLSGTDFSSYNHFLDQAEDYRYQLAQKMNALQMEYISTKHNGSSEGKINVVKKEHFKSLPEFKYSHFSVSQHLSTLVWSIIGLVLWMSITLIGGTLSSKTFRIE